MTLWKRAMRLVWVCVSLFWLQSVQAGATYITFVDNLAQDGVTPIPDGDLVFTRHPQGNGGVSVFKAGTVVTNPATQQAGPIEFTINVDGALPQRSVYLTIMALDVDDDGDPAFPTAPPELDVVEFNGVTAGSGVPLAAFPLIDRGSYLTGFNGLYSTSVFKLPVGSVLAGNNTVVIRPSQAPGSSWAVIVTTAQLVVDGGSGAQGQLDSLNIISANTALNNVDLQVQTSFSIVQAGNYLLEYSVIDPNGNSPIVIRSLFTSLANSLFTRPIDLVSFPHNVALAGDYTVYAQLFYVGVGSLVPVGVPLQQSLNSLLFRPLDSDADGLKDADEVILGTDPHNADTDGDGVVDGAEVGVNYPTVAALDADGDGIIDALESDLLDNDGDVFSNQQDSANTDPCIPDAFSVACLALSDADGDGLSNAQELALGTNPNVADSDGDGINDRVEVGADAATPIDTDGDGIIDALESNIIDGDADGVVNALDANNNNPCLPSDLVAACDSDGDGLSDGLELILGIDPNKADTDGDGINDGIEVGADHAVPLDVDADGIMDALESNLTDNDGDGVVNALDANNNNPCLPSNLVAACDSDSDSDSDGDGISDGLEISLGSNPNNADTDGDGISDQDDPANNNACLPSNLVVACDSDGDGLSDGVELQLGTDPNNGDSDADGVSDFIEVGSITSPSNLDGDQRISALESSLLDSDSDGLNDQADVANLNPCLPNTGNDACLKSSTLDTAVFGAGSQNSLFLLLMVTLMLARFWIFSLRQDVSRHEKTL